MIFCRVFHRVIIVMYASCVQVFHRVIIVMYACVQILLLTRASEVVSPPLCLTGLPRQYDKTRAHTLDPYM